MKEQMPQNLGMGTVQIGFKCKTGGECECGISVLHAISLRNVRTLAAYANNVIGVKSIKQEGCVHIRVSHSGSGVIQQSERKHVIIKGDLGRFERTSVFYRLKVKTYTYAANANLLRFPLKPDGYLTTNRGRKYENTVIEGFK
jgi:hypothetical protein